MKEGTLRRPWPTFALVATVSLVHLGEPARAQEMEEVRVEIERAEGNERPSVDFGGRDFLALPGPGIRLIVPCKDDPPCEELSALVREVDGAGGEDLRTPLQGDEVTGGLAFTVPRAHAMAPKPRSLVLMLGEDEVGEIPLRAATKPRSAATTTTYSLVELLARRCPVDPEGDAYVEDGDIARFDVTPTGRVERRPGVRQVDEDDVVVVRVHGPIPLLKQLRVERASAFRDPGGIRVLGEEIVIPATARDVVEQAAGVKPEPKCGVDGFTLTDFASGEGEVSIEARTDQGSEKVGEFSFAVNPLYDGSFSLGFIWTDLEDPRFGVVFNGRDSVVSEVKDPSDELRGDYAFFYTPFWPARDVEKDQVRLSPTIGVLLEDTLENFLAGGAIDYRASLYLIGGVHFGRVQRLDERSELAPGDPFPGPETDIPVVKEWDAGLFFGVSLDLRVVGKILKSAFGQTGG